MNLDSQYIDNLDELDSMQSPSNANLINYGTEIDNIRGISSSSPSSNFSKVDR